MTTLTIANDSIAQQTLIRIGALSSIVGAIIFMFANIAHPRSPNIEVNQAQIETVANSSIWLTDHLLLFLGGFLLLGGFVAIQRSITSGVGAAWAQLGYVSAIVSTSVWTVLMAVDGITSKVVHSAWATAPLAEKATALRIADMMENIDIGIFSLYIVVFFGITFILYGLAVAQSDTYPQWLGWVAVVLAVACLVVGVVQVYTGLSVLVTNILFTSFSSFLTLWMLVMGILTWRSVKPDTGKSPPAHRLPT